MYIRNLHFRVIVPVCYQMRLNVVFSGLFDSKKNNQLELSVTKLIKLQKNLLIILKMCIFALKKKYHHRNHSRNYFSDLNILSPIISRI